MNIRQPGSRKRTSDIYTDILGSFKSIFFLVSIAFALCVWILDPFINAVFLNEGTIYQLLTQQDTHEILIRSVISVLIITMGFIGGYLLHRYRMAEKALIESSINDRGLDDIQKSHKLYSHAEKMGMLGHWEWDVEKEKTITCSDQYAKIFDQTLEEVMNSRQSFNEDVDEFIHKDDRARYIQLCKAAYEHKENWDIEYRCITKAGREIYVKEKGEPILDENGTLIRTFGTIQDITELKLKEQELKKSNTLYNQTEQVGKLGHWDWDEIKQRFIFCSIQYAKIFDMSVEQMVETVISFTNDIELIYKDDRERYAKVLNAAYKRKEAWNIEYRILNKSGKMIYVNEIGKPVLDDHGTIIRTIGTLQDSTELKQKEQELRKSHTLFKQAEHLGKLGYWEWDIEQDGLINCSEQYANIFNMTVEEVINLYTDVSSNDIYKTYIHKDDLDRYTQITDQAYERKESWDIEFRVLIERGEIYVHEIGEPIIDEYGAVIRTFGTLQDITEHKLAEEELRKSHLLYSQAEQMGMLGHWEWDVKEDRFITCSKQYANIFDMTVKEIFDSPIPFDQEVDDFVHKDDREQYLQEINEAYENKVAWNVEYRCITKTGREIYVKELGEPVFNIQGEIIRSFGTLQDITQRKQAENEILKSQMLYKNAEALGHSGHYRWDVKNSCMISCSEEYARIQEMTVEEALSSAQSSESDAHNIHPDDREDYLHKSSLDEVPDQIRELEYRIITKSGKIRHVKELSEGEWDEHGNLVSTYGTLQDITERKQAEEKLSFQASHDSLTGLVNRSEFERRTERLLSMIKDDKSEHAICYMDLDQFKVVNDTCGHIAGDELLRQLSLVLQNTIRHRDTLARLGGDEFGVLIEHCTLEQAKRVTNSLQQAVHDFHFSWEGHNFRVGVSMGLVAITEDISSMNELMKRADAACYMAKDLGRNRIHIYRGEDVSLAQRHGEMQWVTRLHKALEENRFCLYAQSIVPLDGSKEMHFELLIRMMDEDGKLIPPGAFLPAAERYNLIVQLDSWVIKKAFSLLAQNLAFQEHLHFVSINISGQSLADDIYQDFVICQLEASGISPDKICFEITETAAISNLGRANAFITQMSDLGCRFALDDFGSGLSSFAYLKNLPVDYLKIDGMFVKDIIEDPIDHAMVKSINQIGQVMGMRTIAEFVENNTIKGMLKEIGVNYAQGYGISKPLPFEEILDRANNVTDIKNFIEL